jgi:hypothetical protein
VAVDHLLLVKMVKILQHQEMVEQELHLVF